MRAGYSFPCHPSNSQKVPQDKGLGYLNTKVYVIQEERPPNTKEPPSSSQGMHLTTHMGFLYKKISFPIPGCFQRSPEPFFPEFLPRTTADPTLLAQRSDPQPCHHCHQTTCLSSGLFVPRSYAEDGGDNESLRLFFSLLWLCLSGSRSLLRMGFFGVGV